MKRVLWNIVILLLIRNITWASGGSSHPNNLLILIEPAFAGPSVNPENYWKPEWVLWPPAIHPGNGGRLLSMATGANWVGDATFFRTTNASELKRRGFFEVRQRLLGDIRTDLLLNLKGGASSNALLLSLNSGTTKIKPYFSDEAWPEGSLMVGEAGSWDEVKSYESTTSGRVLVVEYPPQADVPWTRYWLRGHNWPLDRAVLPQSRTHSGDRNLEHAYVPVDREASVPGLIAAKDLLKLAAHPDEFRWDHLDSSSWSGANQFLILNHREGPIFCGIWMLLLAAAIAYGSYLVGSERNSRWMPQVLAGLIISPAIVVLTGTGARMLGPGAWPVWLVLSTLLLGGASAGATGLQAKFMPKAHPLLGVFAVGFFTLLSLDPVWSFLSPLFGGRQWPVSAVALAAQFGTLTGVVACSQGSGRAAIGAARAACLLWVVFGFVGHRWWAADPGALVLLGLLAWLIGERKFHWLMSVPVVLWPFSLVPILAGGLVWAPAGLVFSGRDLVGLNLYEYFEFLTSNSLLVFLPIAIAIAMFGYRFFFHQLRILIQLDLRRGALPASVVLVGLYGLLHPIVLYGALTLAVGALLGLLFDAVQTM